MGTLDLILLALRISLGEVEEADLVGLDLVEEVDQEEWEAGLVVVRNLKEEVVDNKEAEAEAEAQVEEDSI